MMLKSVFAWLALIAVGCNAMAQHQDVSERPSLWKGRQNQTDDTSSLLHAFKKGQMHGHFRYYFMATDNAKGLSDHYANALGGGIKYETAPFMGFQFGVSGFFVFNIGSSDLTKPDPVSNQMSRYELSLFDINDPSNKNDIDRLEELYVKYSWKKSHITFGKQLINTPFINLQDGRMRPTEVGGIYGGVNEIKNTKIEAGFLYQVSPRSTVKWYKVGESIGLYTTGVNPDGTKSGYAGNLKSRGISVLGVTHQLSNYFSVKAWDVFVENIFNTAFLQVDYTYSIKSGSKIVAGLQYIRQDAVKNGGNEDQSKTYFTKGGRSQTFGARIGWENDRLQTSVNYTRITPDGRYLMPREWGREPFFTYLPRERNDGLGDVHAYVVKAGYSIPKANVKIQAGYGFYNLPEVNDFALNKYGLPSYTQLNIDIRHEFKGFLTGLDAQLLFVHKGRSGNTYGNKKYIINKVNLSSWNLVFNYHF